MKLARTVDVSKTVDLKNRLDGHTRMVNWLFSATGDYAAGDAATEMFVKDLFDFALYIIKADGVVSKDEVEMFNILFGVNASKQRIVAILKERSDADWALFANSLPASIALIAEIEKEVTKQTGYVEVPMSITSGLIDLYVDLGTLLTVADGDINDKERENYRAFVSRLFEFLDDEKAEVLESFEQ